MIFRRNDVIKVKLSNNASYSRGHIECFRIDVDEILEIEIKRHFSIEVFSITKIEPEAVKSLSYPIYLISGILSQSISDRNDAKHDPLHILAFEYFIGETFMPCFANMYNQVNIKELNLDGIAIKILNMFSIEQVLGTINGLKYMHEEMVCGSLVSFLNNLLTKEIEKTKNYIKYNDCFYNTTLLLKSNPNILVGVLNSDKDLKLSLATRVNEVINNIPF